MPHVDDTTDTLMEVFGYEYDFAEKTLPALEAPPIYKSRVTRFFESFAASMRLQRRPGRMAYADRPVLTPADILAQNYPHLYLQVMCG
jgi:hypothetical protein